MIAQGGAAGGRSSETFAAWSPLAFAARTRPTRAQPAGQGPMRAAGGPQAAAPARRCPPARRRLRTTPRRLRSEALFLPPAPRCRSLAPPLVATAQGSMTELLDLTQCEDFFGHCPVHAAHPPRECQLNFFDLSTHTACCTLCVAAQPLDTYIQVRAAGCARQASAGMPSTARFRAAAATRRSTICAIAAQSCRLTTRLRLLGCRSAALATTMW